jgi:WD40 repeat protein
MSWVSTEPLVLQGSEDLHLRLWDHRAMSKPAAVMAGYTYFPLTCAAMGDYFLTGSNGFDGEGCELRLWDRRTLRQLVEMKGHLQAVSALDILPPTTSGASTLMAVSGSKDGELRLWELSSGACVAQQHLPAGGVCGLAASLPEDHPHTHFYTSTTCGEVHAYQADKQTGFVRVVTSTATGS